MTAVHAEPSHGSISAGFTIRRGAIDESATLPTRDFDLIVTRVSLVHIAPGGNLDLVRVSRRLCVELSINSKPFLRVPIRTLAGLHGLDAMMPTPLGLEQGILLRSSDVAVLGLSTRGQRVWPARNLRVSIGLAGIVRPSTTPPEKTE